MNSREMNRGKRLSERRAEAGISRRAFMKSVGAVGIGSLLFPDVVSAGLLENELPRRPFGKTGVELPVLSFGGFMDLTENQLILGQAIKHGVTYWDTAERYSNGKSEEGIGRYFRKHSEARKRIFLVSKTGQRDAAGAEKDLNQSLERMGTDHIDLYFFHGTQGIDEIDRDEIKEWAERAKKAKKIRFVGLSTHKNMARVLMGASKLGWIDGLMTTYNYRVMHDDAMQRGVEACHKAGLGITAMKTQGKTFIEDGIPDREISDHFGKRGFTVEQAKIKSVWEDARIATICSAMPTVDILETNVAAALDRTKLSALDRRALARHAAATCAGYCRACGACERLFAGRLPVSSVMRYLMYSRGYGDRGMARESYRAVSGRVRAQLAVADFRKAERGCPHSLPIGRLMKEAELELA